jgi:peptidase S41-like protein
LDEADEKWPSIRQESSTQDSAVSTQHSAKAKVQVKATASSQFFLRIVLAFPLTLCAQSFILQASTDRTGKDTELDRAARHRLILGVAQNLKQSYVDRKVGRKLADDLLTREHNGDYDKVTDGPEFAALLTRQIRDASNDMEMEVIYSQSPLPEGAAGPDRGVSDGYRQAMQRSNCSFEKIEVLPGNIGYLKLNSFPEASVCGHTAKDAMAKLNDADAIIFDLRDNRGGFPNMVALLVAYLFDHPEYLYNPRENTTEQSWTRSPVAGNKLADKPVYVLTSRVSISAAEQFTYDLKMLKRATIVGETTAGAAHGGWPTLTLFPCATPMLWVPHSVRFSRGAQSRMLTAL